jgi:hypothetical protein
MLADSAALNNKLQKDYVYQTFALRLEQALVFISRLRKSRALTRLTDCSTPVPTGGIIDTCLQVVFHVNVRKPHS